MGPAPREPDRREPGAAPREPGQAPPARAAGRGQAPSAAGVGAAAGGPGPSQAAQALAFARGAFSYWTSVFPRVCVCIVRWRRRADAIPDPVLRHFALEALAKRSDIEGAAVFAAFAPWRHRGAAARAASAYQCAYSLLDMLGEQPSAEPVRDGRQLHEALVFAVSPMGRPGREGGEPRRPRPEGGGREGWEGGEVGRGGGEEGKKDVGGGAGSSGGGSDDDDSGGGGGSSSSGSSSGGRLDWYEHHPQRDDGGHLDSLLDECRAALATLPSYATVAPWAREAAERTVAFQSLNLSETQGDHRGLERWAVQATPDGTDLRWWETAAAAGSSLAVLALIAAAASARLPAVQTQALAAAYFPWIGCLHSLLDNLIDKHEDEAAGHRSLLAYYGPPQAARRLGTLTERARAAADALPHPQRHRVMLTAMIANYLSTPEAHGPELRAAREAVIARAGPLVRPAMWVFAIRRLGTRG